MQLKPESKLQLSGEIAISIFSEPLTKKNMITAIKIKKPYFNMNLIPAAFSITKIITDCFYKIN